MSNIDDRIRKSLSSEDQVFLAELDAKDSLYGDIAATFQGRMRWLNALGLIFGFALFAIAVFCAWRFVTQTDLRTMQLWGAGAALAFLGLGLIKLWFWFDLKANAIVREVKRVELQVSSLAAALRNGGPG
jgi:uncharacterized membrane protein